MRPRLLIWVAVLIALAGPAAAADAASGARALVQDDGRIPGKVTDEVTSLGIPFAGMFAYRLQDGSLSFVSSTTTDASGLYEFSSLATGTYFVFTAASGYINEISDDVQCPGECSIASLTPGARRWP